MSPLLGKGANSSGIGQQTKTTARTQSLPWRKQSGSAREEDVAEQRMASEAQLEKQSVAG
jgi:hypothetical protein